jgi:tetratricopeptide (TPR) repeat protein
MAEGEIKLRPEIEKLSIKLETDPKSRVFAQLADAYRKSNMVDEAIEIAKKGLEIHPNYAAARLVLGRCYLEKRIFSLAREELERAVNLDPYNSVTLMLLADALLAQGAKGEAIRRYQQVVDMDPLNNEVTGRLEELLPPPAAQEPGKGAPEPISAATPPSGTALAGEQFSDTIENMLAEKGWGARASHPEPENQAATPSEVAPLPELVLPSPEPVLESEVLAPEGVYKPAFSQKVEESSLSTEGTSEVAEGLISGPGFVTPALGPPGEEAALPELEAGPEVTMAVESGSGVLSSPPGLENAPLTGEEMTGIVAELIADRNLGVPAISPPEFQAMIEQKPPKAAPLAKVEEAPVPAKAKGIGATATLAELYEQQRFYDKALELYEQVLAENPENPLVQAKVRELRDKNYQGVGGEWGTQLETQAGRVTKPLEGVPEEEPRQEPATAPPQTEESTIPVTAKEQSASAPPEEREPKEEIKSFQDWLDSLIKSKPGS